MEASHATGSILLLTRLARAVYRRSTKELLGIHLKELATLAYLRDHEGASQQALTQALMLDANSCVLLLNELETAGYAERRRDPDDRRRHIVALTTAGRAALERAERAQESIEDEVLANLGHEERAALKALLSRALGSPAQPTS
ncbi:MAG: MarR family transcriptional regulator, temperature-dependent positive regulator of motility [Gaiellales bacterium]|jgi:DNA-binding MarR family transcriptional regulator|nr:MarR family transcriptional regulator, temperature-dependent positive regulator of motility [Gaiellales bacterium]